MIANFIDDNIVIQVLFLLFVESIFSRKISSWFEDADGVELQLPLQEYGKGDIVRVMLTINNMEISQKFARRCV